MEQPEANPRFCTNNCGFYGSSQFEGMCSKCYRDHVSRSYNAGRPNSFNSFYASSNVPAQSPSHNTSTTMTTPADDVSQVRNDEDEVVGHMDEDNQMDVLVDSTVNNNNHNNPDTANDNSELPIVEDSSSSTTTNPPMDESDTSTAASLLTRVVSTPTMPIAISKNIAIPVKNEPNISVSAFESQSLGVESTSPTIASSVDKKKRNRCSWETCNKKLGLTGFDCRCGGHFCPLHRYANEHNCTFDYKGHGQNEIRKNMPVVQADRVRKI